MQGRFLLRMIMRAHNSGLNRDELIDHVPVNTRKRIAIIINETYIVERIQFYNTTNYQCI